MSCCADCASHGTACSSKMSDYLSSGIAAALPAVAYDVFIRGVPLMNSIPLAAVAGASAIIAGVAVDAVGSGSSSYIVKAAAGGAAFYGLTTQMGLFQGNNPGMILAEGAAYTVIGDIIEPKLMSMLPSYGSGGEYTL